MNESPQILPGRYRHFKGNEYTVLGTARHSETLEPMVVYRQEYGERGLWVRPAHMFIESVTANDRIVPRFQSIKDESRSAPAPGDNLFAGVASHLPQEVVETLVAAANVRIERIVSHGHASPEGHWFDQDQHEWVVLLKGAARMLIQGDDRPIVLQPGDFLNIPAHQRHRVEWTTPDEPTIWLAVHYGGIS